MTQRQETKVWKIAQTIIAAFMSGLLLKLLTVAGNIYTNTVELTIRMDRVEQSVNTGQIERNQLRLDMTIMKGQLDNINQSLHTKQTFK